MELLTAFATLQSIDYTRIKMWIENLSEPVSLHHLISYLLRLLQQYYESGGTKKKKKKNLFCSPSSLLEFLQFWPVSQLCKTTHIWNYFKSIPSSESPFNTIGSVSWEKSIRRSNVIHPLWKRNVGVDADKHYL